ncbi:MAG: hypothetical protein ACI9VO_001022, partial [Colwellia sp.]
NTDYTHQKNNFHHYYTYWFKVSCITRSHVSKNI